MWTFHILEVIERQQGELLVIAQAIQDAQAKLDAAIKANSDKVDGLLSALTNAGGATAAEEQQIADAINASAAAVEAINAKS